MGMVTTSGLMNGVYQVEVNEKISTVLVLKAFQLWTVNTHISVQLFRFTENSLL
jgi:hypothetical protein